MANLIEHNHCDIESWYNSNADSRWKTQKWFRLYFDKTILCRILLVSHGLFRNENSTKGSNLTSDDFFPGIFIWCYIQVKLANLIDNDDGILWQNYFAKNATIFPWFFQERKFDQRQQHDLCKISSRLNWRCYIWIKSANLIEHNHCDIESWYNSNADSRWKTQIKVIPFVFWQNNFVQNSIIPMVFSGTKILLKTANWPAMNFLPGIFIWCYIQVKLAILIDNDDGIL